ncbi:MAG: 30S ribosomal protein S6 [Deltaproteobacteria bacterium]|nr:30S ribosomal protein S6 [Deltaproteobacteria bacterium]
MSAYEVIVAIKADLPDAAVRGIRDKFAEVVSKYQGNIVAFEDWGKRKLAYPIRKQTKGHYLLHLVNAAGDFTKEIERSLRIRDEVLRFLTVKVSDEDLLAPPVKPVARVSNFEEGE